MSTTWLPIRYRDFHDIPRAIVVEYEGGLYLLDCLFDFDLDDYESDYTIYRLPSELRETVDEMSWTDLGYRGERVDVVPTAVVEFDSTKRSAINSKVFDRWRKKI